MVGLTPSLITLVSRDQFPERMDGKPLHQALPIRTPRIHRITKMYIAMRLEVCNFPLNVYIPFLWLPSLLLYIFHLGI